MTDPAQDPNNSPKPVGISGHGEINLAVHRFMQGAKQVRAGTDVDVARLESFGNDLMAKVAAEASPGLNGHASIAHELESRSGKTRFVADVIDRRSGDQEAAVVFSPKLVSERPIREAPQQYLIPPWTELHPEIAELFRRGSDGAPGNRRQVREMDFNPYRRDQIEIIHAPIAVVVTDKVPEEGHFDPLASARVALVLSTEAFREASRHLITQFDSLTKPQGTDGSDPLIEAHKLNHRRRGAEGLQPRNALSTEVSLDVFMQRCPCYLAGLVAREVILREMRESAAQTDDQSASIRSIKLTENWGVSIKVAFGSETVRELVISKTQPERVSFA